MAALRRSILILFVLALAAAALWLGAGSAGAAVAAPPAPPTTTEFKLGAEAQTQVDGLSAQVQAVEAEIAALSDQLNRQIDDYYRCRSDLEATNVRLAQLRRQVSDAQAKKARAQALLAQRIKALYMSGGRDQLFQLLLLADSLDDLYNRVRLVSTLADQDQHIVADLQDSSSRISLLLKEVDGQRRQDMALRRELSERAAEVHATLSEKERMLAGLDAQVKVVIEQERQRQLAEQARLQAELQAKLQATLTAMQNRGSNILSPGQIAVVAQRAGFTGQNLVIAVAVALAESGGNANAEGDVAIGGSFGLWQVYCRAHPDLIPPTDPDSVRWYDPDQNARWAYEISGGSNWYPWSTWKHGTYRAFMDDAQAAVVGLIGVA